MPSTVIVVAALFALALAADREPPSKGYEFVTCGSVLKLSHASSDFRLHSHKVQYGSGSKQQSVTMVTALDDPNSLWQVYGDHESGCLRGHSNHKSPLSNNQEVSAFGDDSSSDQGDLWRLECDSTYWEREAPVRLKHFQTNQYLHSTGQHQYGQPIAGQREVCAIGRANAQSQWRAMEGFFIKAQEKKDI